MRYVAEDLAKKVNDSLTKVAWQDKPKLAARYRELDVKWRTVEPELLDWAIATQTKPENIAKPNDISVIYSGRVQRLSKASPQTKLPVQVLRIGDICIGTTPCETFAETGLEYRTRTKSF
jgi:hypothetical protein